MYSEQHDFEQSLIYNEKINEWKMLKREKDAREEAANAEAKEEELQDTLGAIVQDNSEGVEELAFDLEEMVSKETRRCTQLKRQQRQQQLLDAGKPSFAAVVAGSESQS